MTAIKKTPFLKELQEYLREGSRTVNKLETWLIKAEQHIKELERRDAQQYLITEQEKNKKLTEELQELRKDPHTALNKSEKKIELILHKIIEAENYLLGTYIKVLAKLGEWKETGTTEQKNALIKYKDKLENAQQYLTTQDKRYKEALIPKKEKQKPNTPWNEILGENYFD